MREIKFRAWDDYNKVMINPYCELKENRFWGEDLTNTGYQTPTAVMQFTGLHDRNGKEIYEGDIYQVAKNVIYQVVFVGTPEVFEDEALMGGFGLRNDTKGLLFQFDTYSIKAGEIIGNIYENPELLNQKEG